MKRRQQKGFTLIELLVVITIIAILASLAVPVFSRIQERGNQTKAINNARQISLGLKTYASDNNGNYPYTVRATGSGGTSSPVTNANDICRELVKDGIITTEAVFSSPASPYVPDGDLGAAPGYTEAVKTNENHWAITASLSDSSPGNYGLVFENPSNNTNKGTSEPTWDPEVAGQNIKGRTWSGGKIIVATNDGSVSTLDINNKTAVSGLKTQGSSGTNAFKVTNTRTLEWWGVLGNGNGS